MNIELGVLKDGGVLMVSDEPLPQMVKRVEFYRDQSLLMLVYDNEAEDTQLMHYEIPITMSYPLEKSPNVIIYSVYPEQPLVGYKVPLIKIGDVF